MPCEWPYQCASSNEISHWLCENYILSPICSTRTCAFTPFIPYGPYSSLPNFWVIPKIRSKSFEVWKKWPYDNLKISLFWFCWCMILIVGVLDFTCTYKVKSSIPVWCSTDTLRNFKLVASIISVVLNIVRYIYCIRLIEWHASSFIPLSNLTLS